MEKFNVQVNGILLALQTKLAADFGPSPIDRKTILQLAKELGFLQGKRGREGGTFATELGMTFANLTGEIIRPTPKVDKSACPLPVLQDVPTVLAQAEVP